jgi:hypothetical protein
VPPQQAASKLGQIARYLSQGVSRTVPFCSVTGRYLAAMFRLAQKSLLPLKKATVSLLCSGVSYSIAAYLFRVWADRYRASPAQLAPLLTARRMESFPRPCLLSTPLSIMSTTLWSSVLEVLAFVPLWAARRRASRPPALRSCSLLDLTLLPPREASTPPSVCPQCQTMMQLGTFADLLNYHFVRQHDRG